jgi:exopolysaccharide/PEP-CTERM locus tyrosine autokinase
MRHVGYDKNQQVAGSEAASGDGIMPDDAASEARTDLTMNAVMNESKKPPNIVQVLERLRDKGMLVPGSKLGPEVRNEYRRIKRPLLSNAFGKSASLVDQGNLIMVTSAVPGEGKTYTAVNLALALAQERDHTVLLVDCDVTKQGVSRLLGVEKRRPDITDLLASENIPIEDALLKTDVPGLVLLPAGKPHEYITEMMASQRMAWLVNEFATRYTDRIVVFDSPPLLSTPESQVLAGLVGQVVFVIEAGKTPMAIVTDALEMIPQEKAVGLLLNKSESISNRGGYYYNYYTPYGEKDTPSKDDG